MMVCGGQEFVLKAEEFLVWIQFNSENIKYLKILLPESTKLKKWVNYYKKTPEQIPKEHSYIFQRKNFGHNIQALFNFQYDGEKSQLPQIQFFGLDESLNIIAKTEFTLKILIPNVHVEINKEKSEVKSNGFINIIVKVLNSAIITVKDFDINVFDGETNEKIEIVKNHLKHEEFMKLIDELPPEINPNHFLGKIEFPHNKKIKLQIRVQVFDLSENEYWFESNFLDFYPEEIKTLKDLYPLNIPIFEQIVCAN